jgi:aminopeptidase I
MRAKNQNLERLLDRLAYDDTVETESVRAFSSNELYVSLSETKNEGGPGGINRRVKTAKDVVPGEYAQPFMDFISENPTVFHAVDYFCERLTRAGFTRLCERDAWMDLESGGKYFVTRNASSLVAFSIPEDYRAGNGFGKFTPISHLFF